MHSMSSDVGEVTPMRRRLLEAAARLVATGGADALTTRKVAAEAGTSTMAVYTQFGSMEALVGGVVEEGFARLEQRLVARPDTDDPLADVAARTAAYVAHARENDALTRVMFGAATLGRYRPVTPEQLEVGRRETLDRVGDALARAVASGRIRDAGGTALVFRWWVLAHGYAVLEGAGYVAPDRGPERVLGPLLVDFFAGEGDDPAAARASVEAGFRL